MNQKIAILGANGVYARHLIPRLAAEGFDIRAVVRGRKRRDLPVPVALPSQPPTFLMWVR